MLNTSLHCGRYFCSVILFIQTCSCTHTHTNILPQYFCQACRCPFQKDKIQLQKYFAINNAKLIRTNSAKYTFKTGMGQNWEFFNNRGIRQIGAFQQSCFSLTLITYLKPREKTLHTFIILLLNNVTYVYFFYFCIFLCYRFA